MKVAGVSRCFAVRWQQQTQGEEEVLEPARLLLQVCWEGAAGSAWMWRGGKPVGTTSVVLPRTGARILVGMAGLGLETPKLEKGICAFPRKLGLAMGGL